MEIASLIMAGAALGWLAGISRRVAALELKMAEFGDK